MIKRPQHKGIHVWHERLYGNLMDALRQSIKAEGGPIGRRSLRFIRFGVALEVEGVRADHP